MAGPRRRLISTSTYPSPAGQEQIVILETGAKKQKDHLQDNPKKGLVDL